MTPNILFITTDQQRIDTLGCYGNNIIKTPNLDKLASEGVLLERAYCESPVCIPSRVTMITGKAARHHGASLHNTSMRTDEKTLGDVLQKKGYKTGFIGKPHFKSQQHRGTEESIADWRDGLRDGWTGPYAGFQEVELILGHSNPLVGHYGEFIKKNAPEAALEFSDLRVRTYPFKSGKGVHENNIPEEYHSSSYVGERTCLFMEKSVKEKTPFYCFASFPDPHWPIMPPKEYFHLYDDISVLENIPENQEHLKIDYPRQYKDAVKMMKGTGTLHYDGAGHKMENPDEAEAIMRTYWGAVTLIDKNVGKILDKLDDLGLKENTIVVFTTDHGEFMGSHGLMAKGAFLYESYVHVPFICRYPAGEISSGRRSDSLFSFVDIVPTLLDLCNISGQEMYSDGFSQKLVLTGETSSMREAVLIHHPNNDQKVPVSALFSDDKLDSACINPDLYAIITTRWKLVYYAGQKNSLLFDLENDPEELENLYQKKEYRDIGQVLEKRLLNELILTPDRQKLYERTTADQYGKHFMTYKIWGKEYDEILKKT